MHILSQYTVYVQLLVYGSVLVFFWFLEFLLYPGKIKEKTKHTFLNSRFIFLVLPIQILLSLVVFKVADWTNSNHWGLASFLPASLNVVLLFIAQFMMLDFFDYMYHIMMHKTPLFWKFHQVHHSDMDVDISTTLREHPGETFIRVTYFILVVFIIGASPWVLIIKQFIQSFSNLVSHSKIVFPRKVNNIVSLIFVTPNTHRVHHHFELPHTDSNFGDTLAIWDRLFSTFSNLNQSNIKCGLDTHMDSNENLDFKNLLARPFKKK